MIRRLFWALTVALLMFPPLDPYLDDSMSRLMLIQFPLLFILGAVGVRFSPLRLSWGPGNALGLLILGWGGVLFWMVPRSLDLAVAQEGIDFLAHLSLLISGAVLALSLPLLAFPVQIAAAIYGIAMWSMYGLILSQTSVQVCASFSLEQQQATGVAMLWAAPVFLMFLVFWTGVLLVRQGPRRSSD